MFRYNSYKDLVFFTHFYKKQQLSIINQLRDHARSLIPNAILQLTLFLYLTKEWLFYHNKQSSERATYTRYVC